MKELKTGDKLQVAAKLRAISELASLWSPHTLPGDVVGIEDILVDIEAQLKGIRFKLEALQD